MKTGHTWNHLLVLNLQTNDFRDLTIWPLIARFMGPTWGPSGADRTQVGPMNFVIWDIIPGPLFIKGTDVSPHTPVKSRSREIGCYDDPIALQFGRHLGSAVAEVTVKLQSDWKSLNPNLAASRHHEILYPQQWSLSDIAQTIKPRGAHICQ